MATATSRDKRNQEQSAVIRAVVTSATRETVLWLQSASTEEQVHLFGMQAVLGDLARIIERQIEGRALAGDHRKWTEKVVEVKSKLKETVAVQGRIVGETLQKLEARLPNVLAPPRHPGGRPLRPIELVTNYIKEVYEKTGRRITKKDIWSKAGYKTRTEFERWERQDKMRPNRSAHESFIRLLTVEKPHLN